jgi:hypothetical protein
MSKGSKILITVIVIVAIVAVLWYVGWGKKAANAPANENASSTSSSLQTSATDTSNAAIQSDVTKIDTQMNGLSKDSASVDQSLNDKPVQQ